MNWMWTRFRTAPTFNLRAVRGRREDLGSAAKDLRLDRSIPAKAIRNSTTSPMSIDYFKTKGVEGEVRAFLAKRLSLTGTLTWQDPRTVERSVPAWHSAIVVGSYARTRHMAAGSSAWRYIFGLKAPYKVGGQPHWVTSPFATVNVTKNAGFTLGTTWVSSVNAGFVSAVKLHSYERLERIGLRQKGTIQCEPGDEQSFRQDLLPEPVSVLGCVHQTGRIANRYADGQLQLLDRWHGMR